MRFSFFAVYDAKVKTFMRPLMARSFGEAERAFSDAVRHPESDYSRHPEDYSLFHVGYFSEDTGLLEGLVAPVQVCQALQFSDGKPQLVKEG